MMDYYGNIPGPSKENAIKEVTNEIGEEKIVRDIIMKMDSLGSHTGWYVFFKNDVKNKVKKMIRERKTEKYWVEYVMRKIIGDKTFTY